MSPELIGLLGIPLLIILLLLKVPVGISLLLVGTVGYATIRNIESALKVLGTSTFNVVSSYNLSVIPLFIFMGMILSYCGFGSDLYRALDRWMGRVKGGLAISTIGTSAIFGAISGSVNATTATLAKVTLPEMKKFRYDPGLSTASVAAGGTLGLLIPPSVILILYGILTRESIGALLIAGIIPGIIQMIIFIIIIFVLVSRNPSLAPPRSQVIPLSEKIRSLKSVWPFLLMFALSIGGIYFGVFTPTEAAGIGSFGALVIALLSRRLSFQKLKASIDDTLRLSAMIFLILMGAEIFSQFLAISRIPFETTSYLDSLTLNPYIILFFILLTLFVLGLFIEGLSILVITLPIIYPLIIELGFNGVWFGVIMVMLNNIGLLTPPVGVSVFVIKGVAKDVPIQTIFKGVIPMLLAIVICTAILILFPDLVTFLPSLMGN
ncbi:tripartite ATP-independent transporter DctM subunit [Caldalkalibacillus uzonensis]|uniref:Tripartite ATP-independent transporter DctM subunit n=1 Tax=Caldalkalibacillus uzonensis TaxID=353224 RepID=A0ABU0CXZ8_9BACI|nr:TRAP transporter large permease [Caldalkalibacillus uzonensis]MDQ0341028.1 tripartite ATP-independent transporter DctM subunit [Caldalkalibacillus uzonensis]